MLDFANQQNAIATEAAHEDDSGAQGQEKHVIRILCCDGGGVRGAATAGFLEELEEGLRRRYAPNDATFRLSDIFDFIAGNSTGSIIAALIATRRTSREISSAYSKLAKKAFPPWYLSPYLWLLSVGLNLVLAIALAAVATGAGFLIGRLDKNPLTGPWALALCVFITILVAIVVFWGLLKIAPHQWWVAKYGNGGLRAALQSELHAGQQQLALKDVANLTPRNPGVGLQRTLPGCVLLIPSVDMYTRKVVVYKSPHEASQASLQDTLIWEAVLRSTAAQTYLPIVRDPPSGSYFSDGGLWANNPSVIALTEAIKYAGHMGWDNAEIHMLSIGTGSPSHNPLPLPLFKSGSAPYWAAHIIPCMMDAQGRGATYCVGEMLAQSGHFFNRVDFNFEEHKELLALDDSSNVTALIEFGKGKAQCFDHKSYEALGQPSTAAVVQALVERL